MKLILIILTILLSGCIKETSTPPKQETKSVLIRVEVEHIDGEIVTSRIVLVR